MMNLRDAVAECLFERFERQRLAEVLTDLPGFDHSGENIHEQADIDETSIETNIGNIGHPDLILTRDFERFSRRLLQGFITLKRFCGLTRTLDADPEVTISFINRATRLRTQRCIPDAVATA